MTEPRHKIGRSTIPATLAWCAERDHPVTTYNPNLDLSLCRCGEIQVDGDAPMTEAGLRALHDTHHDCEYGTKDCDCYARKWQAAFDARNRR